MKKNIKKIGTAILVMLLCATTFQCSEDFLDRYPLDEPSPANFFVNETSAQNANSAIYNFWMRNANLFGRDMFIILDAMTDDVHWRSNRASSIQQEKWDIGPAHGPINSYWVYVYRSINAANYSIEGIPTCTDEAFSEVERMAYVAEARFMRGFNYLFLVTLFGEVPLILNPLNTFGEYEQPRAPIADIYAAIVDDFTYAKENLPSSWPSAYAGRPTKTAAATYLALAHLYSKDFESSETAAREAITIAGDEGYGLVSDFQSIFQEESEDNSEMIFAFQFVHNSPDLGTNTQVQINPNPSVAEFRSIYGAAWGYSLPQRDLYDAFEADDSRRGYTIYAPGDFYGFYNNVDATITHYFYDEDGVEQSFTRDYTDGDSVFWEHRFSQTGLGTKKMHTDMRDLTNERWAGKDIPLMRMAELYLILAEALAEQGDAEALIWVNMVRSRPSVSLPGRSLGDGRPGDSDLVSIVRHERRVELALECKRLFDLQRWGTLDDVFSKPEPVKRHFYSEYVSTDQYDEPLLEFPKHNLFPIPQSEIGVNSTIQANNTGY